MHDLTTSTAEALLWPQDHSWLAVIALAMLVASIAALKLKPSVVFRGWGWVLVLYALWPIQPSVADPRLAFNLPAEYVPFLIVMTAGAASGLLHCGHLFAAIPKCLTVLTGALALYVIASVSWVVDRAAWVRYGAMWLLYIPLFLLMVGALASQPPQVLARTLQKLCRSLAIYATVVLVRYFLYPSQQFPLMSHLDFTPLIRYRISEVISVLPFLPVGMALYFATRTMRDAWFVAVGPAVLLMTFSRAGIAGLVFILVGSLAVFKGSFLRKRRSSVVALGLLLVAPTAAAFM